MHAMSNESQAIRQALEQSEAHPSLERSAHETVVMTISAVCSVVWSNVIADQHAGLAAQPQAENHLRPYSSCSESPKALPAVHVNFIKP